VQFTRLVESLETPPGAQVSTVKVEVVAGPDLGQTPVAPRPARNLTLAGVIGLLLGVGGAVLREMLDSTVKNAESLQRIVNAPVLATVPFDPTAKKAPVMIGRSRRSHRAEALRKLRTNLHFVDVDEPVRTIVVTSAVSGEGKSSTAVNLAVVFAEASATVLLIDADLRRPRLAEYLGLEGSVGLTNVLAGQLSDTEAVQPWGGGLSVLPSGFIPPNPSELLGSRHMRDLLDRLRDQYDIIIIDSPPLLPVTDAAVVATRADGALLMTRSGKTSQAQARAAAAALSAVGARLLGGVINMEPRRGADRYQYYEYSGSLSPNQTQPVPGDDASTEIAGSASIAQLPGVRTTSPR
jgi:capsular exopolysaccharide synthesis family protein